MEQIEKCVQILSEKTPFWRLGLRRRANIEIDFKSVRGDDVNLLWLTQSKVQQWALVKMSRDHLASIKRETFFY